MLIIGDSNIQSEHYTCSHPAFMFAVKEVASLVASPVG